MTRPQQIHYSSLSKSWNKKPLIESVSITAACGQFTVLCGENGSGKTTLLKIMTGLVRPDGCQILLNEEKLSWKRARSHLITHTLYLHQTPYMFSGSVYRNLTLSISKSDSPAIQRKHIEEVLEMVELDQLKHESAKTLSGGQQQRVALARASLNGSSFLFLDEPTANMDADSVNRALHFMQKLKQGGTSILVSTHSPETFKGLMDRLLVLEDHIIHEQ
ncbi:MAG: ABC transporter ATP-binding protein [Gammaproteobacteria bacterium]|nr:ABC transporter ATP-binding protein [Gammaproteobacteria bacterium]MCY4312686.1 ABC transporter ATP-binding protein [Gammaproteobacteria bacterium]